LKNLNIETIDCVYLEDIIETLLPIMDKQKFKYQLAKVFELYEQMIEKGKLKYYGINSWMSLRAMLHEQVYYNLGDLIEVAEKVNGGNNHFKFLQIPVIATILECLKFY